MSHTKYDRSFTIGDRPIYIELFFPSTIMPTMVPVRISDRSTESGLRNRLVLLDVHIDSFDVLPFDCIDKFWASIHYKCARMLDHEVCLRDPSVEWMLSEHPVEVIDSTTIVYGGIRFHTKDDFTDDSKYIVDDLRSCVYDQLIEVFSNARISQTKSARQ